MFVNYYTSRERIWRPFKGNFSYEAFDILIFNTTDCVWLVPGTF